MQRSAALESIDRAEFGVTQRQVAIRTTLATVNQNVPGAIHRLESEALPFDLERSVHRVRVVFEMTGDLEEFLVHDMRGDDLVVTALAQAFANEGFDDAADDGALRMPKNQAAARVFL